MRSLIPLIAAVMLIGGCAYTPEQYLADQKRYLPTLSELYPPGTPRQQLHDRLVDGEYRAGSITLTDHGTYDPNAHPLMVAATELRTGKRPVSADRFLSFDSYGYMSWSLDYHYVMYDENQRVLTAFNSHLD